MAAAPVAFTTDGNRKDGYTVGAGLEYMFAPNWSAKAEYQYYNFGNTTFTGGPAAIAGARFRDDEHTVKARHQLPVRLGRPGRRAILTRLSMRYERPASSRPFVLRPGTPQGRHRRPQCFKNNFLACRNF